jgi:superfamily I DNA and RNA helicase
VAGIGEQELIQRLKAMFKVNFSFTALTNDHLDTIKDALHPVVSPPTQELPTLTNAQMRTIRGILHPETAIKDEPATLDSVPEGIKLPPNSSVIVGLDIEQERMARDMKDGHRLFSGVAGSGKTLILLCRAKALANRLLEHRILILCFNITLASHLRSLLHSDDQNPQYRERIEVKHFHDWVKSLMGHLPNLQEFNNDTEYNQFLGERVLSILQQLPLERKWDSVLVDEAHTFSANWFLCCVAALKDPLNGDLMVVSDGSQSLYNRQKFTWKSVGIQAQGRSKKLNLNYRNTSQILTAAWNVVQPVSTGSKPVDDDITFPVIEPSAALRHGSRPSLHWTSSKAQAVEALVLQVKQLSHSGYAPGDIAILYRWKARSDDALFQGMLKQINNLGLRTYWITENNQTKRDYSIKMPGVRIVTALSSLGLEFKVVVILWVEQFADCCSPDFEQSVLARRQLYVAMTRAQDELHLFGSGKAAILNELRESQGLDVVYEMEMNTPVGT